MKVRLVSSGQLEIIGENIETQDANRFLNALSLRGLSMYSVRSYAYDLVIIFRWLKKDGFKLSSLEGKNIYGLIRFEKNCGHRATTINRRLITLRVYYRFLFDQELEQGVNMTTGRGYYRGPGSAFMGLVVRKRKGRVHLKVKEEKLLIIPLSAEKANEFIEGIDSYRDLAIVGLMLFCGLRSCEVRNLEIEKINFAERKMTVMGKGGRERMVPLVDQVTRLMRSYLAIERPRDAPTMKLFTVLKGKTRGQALTEAGLRSLFRYKRKISGVAEANPHRFRHTFGTNMAKSKMNIRVLQQLLGHAEGSPVTQRYIHIALADVEEAFHEANNEIKKKYSGLA